MMAPWGAGGGGALGGKDDQLGVVAALVHVAGVPRGHTYNGTGDRGVANGPVVPGTGNSHAKQVEMSATLAPDCAWPAGGVLITAIGSMNSTDNTSSRTRPAELR